MGKTVRLTIANSLRPEPGETDTDHTPKYVDGFVQIANVLLFIEVISTPAKSPASPAHSLLFVLYYIREVIKTELAVWVQI